MITKIKTKDKKIKDTIIKHDINFIVDFSDEHIKTTTTYIDIDISKAQLIIKTLN